MITKNIDRPFSLLRENVAQMNAGGLLNDLLVAPTAWLQEPEILGGQGLRMVASPLLPTKRWMCLTAAHGRVSWDVKSSENANGRYYDHAFGVEIPRFSAEKQLWVERYEDVPMAVLFTDRNGNSRTVGSRDYPAKMRSNATTGARNGKNSLKVNFSATVVGEMSGVLNNLDAITAHLTSIQEANHVPELSFLTDRILALEQSVLVLSGVRYHVLRHEFWNDDTMTMLRNTPFSGTENTLLMSMTLNGVALNARVSATNLVSFENNFLDARVSFGPETVVSFNPLTVRLMAENILILLVRVG